MSMEGFIKIIGREGGALTMLNEYTNLITTLIGFKNHHPEYAEKINKALEAMGVDIILIHAIEEEVNNHESF